MSVLLAHQKQFVLGPHPVRIRPDWICIRLGDHLVLSHCPKLRAHQLVSSDGVPFCLLGLAILADQPSTSVAEAFGSKPASQIEEWTGFWAGKWALVSAGRCWQDASGLIGLYYRHTLGNVWISSSPAILSDYLPGARPTNRLPWRVRHEKGMDWIPAPFSTREEVYKVLALRTIDPRSGELRSVRFAAANGNPGGDVGMLASTLQTILGNWGKEGFTQHLLGLTGGLDSRTVLAAAKAAEVRFDTYTHRHPHMLRHDEELPPQLAARIGCRHTFVGEPGLRPPQVLAREAAITEHMDGALFHPAFRLCASGRGEHLHKAGSSVAGGHTFEIGRCAQWHRFFRAGFTDEPPQADRLLRAFFGTPPRPPSLWIDVLQVWLHTLADPVPLAMDWRDRFYLEQRLGAWGSVVQRTLDILDGTFFYPGNCLWVFHLLLQHEPKKRQAGFAQKGAIRVLEPRLLEFPFNPLPVAARFRRSLFRTYHIGKRALRAAALPNPFKLPTAAKAAPGKPPAASAQSLLAPISQQLGVSGIGSWPSLVEPTAQKTPPAGATSSGPSTDP